MKIYKKHAVVSAISLLMLSSIFLGARPDDPEKRTTATDPANAKPSVSMPVSEEKYEQAKRDAKFLGIDPRVIGPSEEQKNSGAAPQTQSGQGAEQTSTDTNRVKKALPPQD